MDAEGSWQVIRGQRRQLADLLEALPAHQWEQPSLCTGWRVRDVAAHVTMVALPPSTPSLIMHGIRAKGNFHRLNHDIAVRHACRPTAQIVADLRGHADSRKVPAVTNYRNVLFDILVHGQDIAIPLGLEHPMPIDAATAGATRVWSMGWPFWARRRLRALRLSATDVDWSVGAGAEIRGPIEALLLLLTGRTTASLPWLSGEGAHHLAQAASNRPTRRDA